MTTCRYSKSLSSRRRSEEHTSELQSHLNLVCRLLLEKKKNTTMQPNVSENFHVFQPSPLTAPRHVGDVTSNGNFIPSAMIQIHSSSMTTPLRRMPALC